MIPQAFLQFLKEILVFIVYTGVSKQNKDSITQWKFWKLAGSSIEGTGLQVLEASQGGLHPVAGARC